MELSDFADSLSSIENVVQEYHSLERQMDKPPQEIPRLKVR